MPRSFKPAPFRDKTYLLNEKLHLQNLLLKDRVKKIRPDPPAKPKHDPELARIQAEEAALCLERERVEALIDVADERHWLAVSKERLKQATAHETPDEPDTVF